MNFIIAQYNNITFDFCGCLYMIHVNGELKEHFVIDGSKGWETSRHAYTRAVRAYNKLVPQDAAIPCF